MIFVRNQASRGRSFDRDGIDAQCIHGVKEKNPRKRPEKNRKLLPAKNGVDPLPKGLHFLVKNGEILAVCIQKQGSIFCRQFRNEVRGNWGCGCLFLLCPIYCTPLMPAIINSKKKKTGEKWNAAVGLPCSTNSHWILHLSHYSTVVHHEYPVNREILLRWSLHKKNGFFVFSGHRDFVG